MHPVIHVIKERLKRVDHDLITVELAQNQFVNRDDSVGFLKGDPDPIEFLNVDSRSTYIITEDLYGIPTIQVLLALSNRKYLYERSVYTLFTLIGDVGGFNGAIVILPTFLMAIYSERMFKGSISEEIPARKKRKRSAIKQSFSLEEKLRAN